MRLFISYAHADTGQVKQIVDILRVGGHDPWFDHKLLPGQDWQAELLRAITVCDAFLYALTPESVASEWCQWEFAQAVQMGKPVIPVLMQAKTSLPEAISRYQYADFTDGPTPRGVARLLGGLRLVTVVVPRQDAPPSPLNPQGTPAQAVQPSAPETRAGLKPAPAASPLVPPDLSAILPPPFEWCEIPAGWVTLEDASEYGSTKGGKFHVRRFWMAKYPLTNAQYRVFENDEDGYLNPAWWDYSEAAKTWREENPAPADTAFPGDDLPRTNVCWYEAAAFCRWLTARAVGAQGLAPAQITLPTEQQWQRAAQGEDGRVYPWGNNFDRKLCNTDESGIKKTTPVTKYPDGASPYGVLELAGNVWEWCLTEWGTDGTGLEGDAPRVLRGGSWFTYQYDARAAYRSRYYPTDRSGNFGFRVVLGGVPS